jgi:hypothetical protein
MGKKPNSLYTRLPGRGAAGFQSFRLWLGPDHLLQVGSTGVGERYKRVFFHEVQAFLLRKTVGFLRHAMILTFAFASAGTVAFWLGADASGYVAAAVGAVFLILLIVHLLRGPTCTCHVRTAVQFELLPSLSRLRAAERVLAQLQPLIEAAQSSVEAPRTTSATPE